MVSICCLAYNQEAYIAQTLQSFIDQITDFPFEVLVHDDASTDKTADIIRQFEVKYPDIIKPIYQTENQHSKNVRISFTYQYPRATGKYIAMCEGDDYWIDPHKLQKQVDYMEAHPDCHLCFTNGKCEVNSSIERRVIPWTPAYRKSYKPGNADYNMGDMVLLDYVPTASLLCLTEDLKNLPEMSPNTFRGDTFIRLYTTSLGYAHCIDEDTCIYRYRVANSMTTQWNESAKNAVAFIGKLISLLDDMNRITEGKYDAQIQEMKLRSVFRIHIKQQDYHAARQKQFHKLFRSDGLSEYAKYILAVYFPRLFPALRDFSRKLRGKK